MTAAVYEAVKKEKKPKTIKKQMKAKASDIFEDINKKTALGCRLFNPLLS